MDMLLSLIKEFPWFADLVMIMGTLRIIFKPLIALIDTIINQTPSKIDDAKWDQVQQSKLWSVVMFVMDYFASVKIPKKK